MCGVERENSSWPPFFFFFFLSLMAQLVTCAGILLTYEINYPVPPSPILLPNDPQGDKDDGDVAATLKQRQMDGGNA